MDQEAQLRSTMFHLGNWRLVCVHTAGPHEPARVHIREPDLLRVQPRQFQPNAPTNHFGSKLWHHFSATIAHTHLVLHRHHASTDGKARDRAKYEACNVESNCSNCMHYSVLVD